MKVNYLPKSRLRNPYLKRILILIAAFMSGTIIFSLLDSVIISIVVPVWKTENAVTRSLRNGVVFFETKKALVEENVMLKEKVSSLEAKIASISKEQEHENILLELAGRRQESNAVVAAVLTHPPQTPYDVIIIDVGSNKFISLNSKVSLPEGPILGTVFEVFSRSSKVRLFSAPGEKTNAILERNNVPLTLTGNGGGNFKFSLPRDIAVEKGDRILFPDVASQLLAVVEEISVKPTDSFREILARGPANIFALRFVFVTP